MADLRTAFRHLAAHPGFTATAVLTLALGIASTTAMFSIVEVTLLRPLPFRDPDRLVAVWEHAYKRDRPRNVVNPANFVRWQERSRSFENLAAYGGGTGTVGVPYSVTVEDRDGATRVAAGFATGNFFDTLGVRAVVGRALERRDSEPGADPVVVLSFAAWQRRFGGQPAAVGRSLRINGRSVTVVGVLPPAYAFPPDIDLWVAIPVTDAFRNASGRYLAVVGRLAPGVGLDEARAEMQAIAAALEREDPDRDAGWSATVHALQDDLVSDGRLALQLLMAAVALVLVIAAVNVASLLLARGVVREKEMAVRRALGASGWQLSRLVLVECLVVGALGCAAGVLGAAWLLGAIVPLRPPELVVLSPIGLNGRVLAAAVAASLASVLLAGLVPARRAARAQEIGSLGVLDRGSSGGRRRKRALRLLVVSEVALALVLLVGSSLLLRSFWTLRGVDPGFRADGVYSVQLDLAGERYREEWQQAAFFDRALSAIGRLPGVEATGAITWRPLSIGSATRFTLEDRPAPRAGEEPVADVRFVTPGLFDTLGVHVVQGRGFTGADAAGAPLSVVINESAARTLWPEGDAVGRQVRMEWGRTLVAEVIGVVADVRLRSLSTPARATLYWSLAQVPASSAAVMIRSRLDGEALLPAVRAAIRAIDSGVPVSAFTPLTAVVQDSVQQPRFTTLLLAGFAALAFVLAAVGLYGVVSYTASQRTREFGIRLALGARRWNILSLVLNEGLALVLVAVAIGLGASFALTRLARGLLYEISPADPIAFASGTLALAAVALGACLVPARRATRVDPVGALREE